MDENVKFAERHPLTRYIIVGIIILIIAGFVIAIVVANNQSNAPSSVSSNSGSSNQTKKTPTVSVPAQPSQNKPTPNSAGTTSGQGLSDTGPGNTVLLFLAATLITGAAHYGYRRLYKS